MLSRDVLTQFCTYLKSQVGHGWSVEGRKSKGRILTRVSFRYLTGERSGVLLEINFDADNQDDIVRRVLNGNFKVIKKITFFKLIDADCGDLLPTKKNELSDNFKSF